MELIEYLHNHFYRKEELLSLSGIGLEEFTNYQNALVMPKASYTLALGLQCHSFFGTHNESHNREFYAKGYVSWLKDLRLQNNPKQIFDLFKTRYNDTIYQLNSIGHTCSDIRMNKGLAIHIENEWKHFIDGTYGLCTKSGLPEDIARKELASIEIKELTKEENLEKIDIQKLQRAVDLLDSASSLFAPHERQKSSRQALINNIRQKFDLK
ncbi:DUF6058 family natural product biosynthesis protein [Microbulbifer variabilis]|uniref:DUF6058 family natural product biosynthesis protein n=1 Tax=Microbulbifer variabilis TaxID=266805 RepID=UPI001CFDA206|nr:DUF6058 family natural product biosynthesis protein [Microbulbifer variabilis]